MAIMEIKEMGDPVLKEICKPIERVTKKERILLDDMAETMYLHDGVGIAAPQVGVSIRAIVIDVDNKRYDIINPKIIEREGIVKDIEGCLSFPGMYGEVERSEKVKVEYLNRYGKKKIIEAEGLLARCFQHEIDHLDGHLFIEKATNIRTSKKNE